jgi:beta-glucosidase
MNESIRRVIAVLAGTAFFEGALFGQGLVDPDTERKIDALIAQMTLEEKVGQLNQYTSNFDLTGPAPAGGDSKDR